MQRILVYIVVVFMFIMAGLIVAPLLVDTDKYKIALIEEIKSSTGIDTKIYGNIRVSFFPSPIIQVNHVVVENIGEFSKTNILHISSVKVSSSLKALITGDVYINEIKLIRPVLELEEDFEGNRNWSAFENVIQNRNQANDANFPDTVTIVNGTASYNRDYNRSTIDYIFADIDIESISGPFDIEGHFSNDDEIVKFNGNIADLAEGSEAVFSLKSDAINLQLDGSYIKGENPKIEGKVIGNSTSLNKFVRLFFDSSTFVGQITSDEKVNLEGKFVISKDIISIHNMVVDSPGLKGIASVDALLNYENDLNVHWDMTLAIDEIDFDKLYKKDVEDKGTLDEYRYVNNEFRLSDFKFNISKNLSAVIYIDIAQMKYNEGKVENLVIDTDIYKGKATIRKIFANLPGTSELKILGNIEHNGTRPIFKGKLDITGKKLRDIVVWLNKDFGFIPDSQMSEYVFKSDLTMTPQKIDLSNTNFYFDKALFDSEISIRPASTIPVVNIKTTIDRFNVDRYGFTEKINEIISKEVIKNTQ